MLKTRWAASAAIVALFGLAAVVVSVGSSPSQKPEIIINPTAPPESPAPNAGRHTPVPTSAHVVTFGSRLDSPAEPAPIQPTPVLTTFQTDAPFSISDRGPGPTLNDLTVAPIPKDLPDYNRDDWPHWIYADMDCQDTRQKVLIEESVGLITFTDSDQCRVASGEWLAPFTGTTVADPNKLDIAQLVPLANAHRSGGHSWDADKKRAYSNDLTNPAHLVAVTAIANRSKGARGPEDWRPSDESYWCQYAADWVAIKLEWELKVTPAELEALGEMVRTC